MKPNLFPGDYVIGTSFLKNLLDKGKIVIFFDKTHSYVIKRVLSMHNKEYIKLQNDNPYTSSLFCDNPINKNKVLYLALFIIRKKYIDIFIKFKDRFIKSWILKASGKI